jgi:hypothetical protein
VLESGSKRTGEARGRDRVTKTGGKRESKRHDTIKGGEKNKKGEGECPKGLRATHTTMDRQSYLE